MRLLIGTLAATTALTLPAFAQTTPMMDYTTATCADFTGLSTDDQTLAFQDLQTQAMAGMTANADATGTDGVTGDAASTDTATADAGAASTDTGAASTDTATTDTATADAGAASTDTGAASTDTATTDTTTQTADAGATSGTDSTTGAVTGTESTAADTSTAAAGTETQDPMLVAILAACQGNPDQLVIDAMMQVQTDMGTSGMATDSGTAPATE
jgi:hypothetical protein